MILHDYAFARAHHEVRVDERQILIDLLRLEPGHIVVDVPAWIGYVADGIAKIHDPALLICIEPQRELAAQIDHALTVLHSMSLSHLPLPSNHVDRVVSAVGLHHLPDRATALREMVRILKPGGLIVLNEVLADTTVAWLLNDAVHRHSWTGHCGRFLHPGEASTLLEEAGCVDVIEQAHAIQWRFSSVLEMGMFCRSLLRMERASVAQVIHEVSTRCSLDSLADGSVRLPWPLVYATGVKPMA